MKRTLLTALLSCLAIVSVRADVIWTDTFTYSDGYIVTSSANLWTRSSGSGNDALVKSGRLENSATGGNPVGRQDDVQRRVAATAGSPYTNGQQTIYASYIINCTNFPNAASTYFTHFIGNGGLFMGKVFALTNTSTLPNTWRLAAANGANTPSTVLNIDLATNVDYQVVESYDPVNGACKVWVNPISSSDVATSAGDLVSAATLTNTLYFYQARQASTFGNWFATIDNLTLATTFEEALLATQSTNAVAPIIARSPASRTNFEGDDVVLAAVAAGQGQGSMNYQWQKDGTNIFSGTNVFTMSNVTSNDSGNYTMIATTPYGLSATSTVALISIIYSTNPPVITQQPATNTSVYPHQTAVLAANAAGQPPRTFQWYYGNSPATGPNVSGADTLTLTITDVQAANSTTGAYYLVVSNPNGSVTSTVANVSLLIPANVSIAYLRTLVDTGGFSATNSTTLYQATGTVTTFTNLTTGNTSSYYLQDGTAGINIFATFAQTFRPAQGDVVTFFGFLSSFRGTLELGADTQGNPATSYTIVSNQNVLPAPKVISWANLDTNGVAVNELKLEGSLVMLTNVYFGTNSGAVISGAANSTYRVTNAIGQVAYVVFYSQDLDTVGRTVPTFARSVIGPLTQSTNVHNGYEVSVTRWSDVVTDTPPAVTLTESHSGNNTTLTWPNVSWDNVNYSYGSNYSYTILAAQPSYKASLVAANEVPATSSTATGNGKVVVSPDGTTITVNFSFSGLTGPATAAHIHGPAGAGTNASVLFPFSGVPAATSGSIPEQSFTLTPIQAGYLANGLLYMNVHTGANPGGEIRDQLRPAVDVTGPYVPQYSFQAGMQGVNEVPGNAATATGFGRVVLSPDQTTITVDESFSGLTGPATASHIHGPAGAGTNAAVLFPFIGVPAATSGSIPQQSFAITPTQVGYLQTGLLYMNVHTAANPGGEIRAQLRLVPSTGLTSANTSLTNTTPTTATYTDSAATGGQGYYKVVSP